MNKIMRLFFALAIVSFGVACKHYADPPSPNETYSPVGNINSKRKVLLVSIDGVSGKLLSNLQLPTVDSILKTSKYSFNQTLDIRNTEPTGWKCIMTGTSYSINGVADSTFTPEAPTGDDGTGFEHSTPDYYPTFLSYIGQLKSDINIYSITPWERLAAVLFRENGESFITMGDMATRDTAAKYLSLNTTDVVIADFNGANVVGRNSSYDSANATYISAIKTIDSYLGVLLDTIQHRKDYANEEWLIVLTCDQGGVSSGGAAQNGFQLLSSKYFTKEELMSNSMLSVAFKGKESSATTAVAVDSLGQFDLGAVSQKMTISMKININPDATYNWPTVLSKRKSINTGTVDPGWCFFLENDFWQFALASSNGITIQIPGSSIKDGRWHDITAVIDYDGSKRVVKTYTDGVYNTSKDITNMGTITSPNNLIIGYIPQYSPSAPIFQVADIRIFNTALQDADVKNNICLTNITNHPLYNNLKGYWSCNEGIGPRFKSSMPKVGDFWLQNNYAWVSMDTYPCSIAPNANANSSRPSILTQSADIAPNILTWLRIDVDTKWGMDGQAWITKFASEYIKLNPASK